MKRVGIFSGTFDPIHVGHVEVCLVAKAACELDEILVFVEKNPGHKQGVSSYEDRLTMAVLALNGFNSINVVSENIADITYKNTQNYLGKHYSNYTPVLIIGSDMVEHLESWQDAATILGNMEVGVFLRNLKEQKTIKKQLEKLHDKYDMIYKLLPPVWSAVSSSIVKDNIKKHGTSDLIHKDVLKYMRDNKLYGEDSLSGTSK